jgi:hypothetical protein
MILWEIKFWRVADPYAHYNNSEDIFSIPTVVAFPLQHMLLVPLMIRLSDWVSVIREFKVLLSFMKQHPYPKWSNTVGYDHERILLSERLEAK